MYEYRYHIIEKLKIFNIYICQIEILWNWKYLKYLLSDWNICLLVERYEVPKTCVSSHERFQNLKSLEITSELQRNHSEGFISKEMDYGFNFGVISRLMSKWFRNFLAFRISTLFISKECRNSLMTSGELRLNVLWWWWYVLEAPLLLSSRPSGTRWRVCVFCRPITCFGSKSTGGSK